MPSFKLSNINLQITKVKLNTEAKFMLKFILQSQKGASQIILKKPAQFIINQSLLWPQSISISLDYQQQVEFQIHQVNNLSTSNPQQHNHMYTGHMSINNCNQDYLGWQVMRKRQVVGHLFASIQLENKSEVKFMSNSSFFGSTIELKKDSIAFTSIYAKFPLLDMSNRIRIYFEFQMGGVVQRTTIKKINQGEYHSYETLQIKYTDPNVNKLTVLALTFEDITNRIVKIGQGSTTLIFSQQNPDVQNRQIRERIKLQKIFFYDKNQQEIGWMSFKYIKTKEEKLDPRYFLQDKLTTVGDVNFKSFKSQSVTKSQIRAVSSKPFMSSLESNSRIFIPTSPRFEDPMKLKKSQQIGIGHQSLKLNDHPSYMKYRYATLGYGIKVVPVERDRSIPGIGRYNLPSLFDRYK